jgi:hypothetical protein
MTMGNRCEHMPAIPSFVATVPWSNREWLASNRRDALLSA